MIPYAELLKIRSAAGVFNWSERDAMLYALATGVGQDPLDAAQLRFVYEKDLKVMPSFATVAAWGCNPSLAEAGINYTHVVHAEQGVTFHAPLPPAAQVRAEGGVTGAIDKGDKGALIFGETTLVDVTSGIRYATLATTWMARADGHFGGPKTPAPAPHPMPDRVPDRIIDYTTRPDQALLYRLLGDRNPLHADPKAAQAAGFSRPILHGLCTYGITCRAVLEIWGDLDPARMASHSLRFSAPVLPGETITISFWREPHGISFEAHVTNRGVAVVRNGRSVLHM